MSRVTLVLMQMNKIVEDALAGQLTIEELLEQEHAVRRLAGVNTHHASEEVTFAPFLEIFFRDAKAWLKKEKLEDPIPYYARVLAGKEIWMGERECRITEEDHGKHAPSWYKQALELGKNLNEPKASGDEKHQDKAAFLLRNIPVDTTLGFIASAYLREKFHASPNSSVIKKLWRYLNEGEPLDCKLKVTGTYSWLEF